MADRGRRERLAHRRTRSDPQGRNASDAPRGIDGIAAGTIRNRKGEPYKPSVRREYTTNLRKFVLPELGAHRLSEIRRRDLQGFVDRLLDDGQSPTRIHTILMPVRTICAWDAANVKRAKAQLATLQPITLHECRHSYVSLMHDAGLSLEQVGDYVGHSSAYMTDAYRHLIDGHEQLAAAKFDAYIDARHDAQAG